MTRRKDLLEAALPLDGIHSASRAARSIVNRHRSVRC